MLVCLHMSPATVLKRAQFQCKLHHTVREVVSNSPCTAIQYCTEVRCLITLMADDQHLMHINQLPAIQARYHSQSLARDPIGSLEPCCQHQHRTPRLAAVALRQYSHVDP